jgi:argininosuccinate lyase|tara:strand:+ start:395 stop:1801 length:1407 start_codon:yes stop_codon:yes gene_type:complete
MKKRNVRNNKLKQISLLEPKSKKSSALEEINSSVSFDQKIAEYDVLVSMAHCNMLVKKRIIPKSAGESILKGLKKILTEVKNKKFTFNAQLEDVHMNIEFRLKKLIGKNAGMLHTARSRNDLVATDFRLWVRDSLDVINSRLKELQKSLIQKAEKHHKDSMPGFTHLQFAQPVTFGHHLLAYVEMFGRDRERINHARDMLNECPLGAAALAGTSFPIDRYMTAKTLGFDRPSQNSIDSVSDRDFALDFLSSASISFVHLSRLAEELTVWLSEPFSLISLPKKLTTSSSIMPQKKNPDAAELVRGKSGRVFGHLFSLLTTMKGLPLAYCKDLQEDKEPVFDCMDTWLISINIMSEMINSMKFNKSNSEKLAKIGYSTSTDLADFLVKDLCIPFREAYLSVKKIIDLSIAKKTPVQDLEISELKKIEPKITKAVYDYIDVAKSIRSKKSFGGTAPSSVKKAISAAKRRFL